MKIRMNIALLLIPILLQGCLLTAPLKVEGCKECSDVLLGQWIDIHGVKYDIKPLSGERFNVHVTDTTADLIEKDFSGRIINVGRFQYGEFSSSEFPGYGFFYIKIEKRKNGIIIRLTHFNESMQAILLAGEYVKRIDERLMELTVDQSLMLMVLSEPYRLGVLDTEPNFNFYLREVKEKSAI